MAKKQEGLFSVIWKIRYLLLTALALIVGAVYMWTNYLINETAYKYPAVNTKVILKRKGQVKVDNAEHIRTFSDGTWEAFGKGLSLSDYYDLNYQLATQSKPIAPPVLFIYTYWRVPRNLTTIQALPGLVGASYTVFKPFGISALIAFNDPNGDLGYIGTYLQF